MASTLSTPTRRGILGAMIAAPLATLPAIPSFAYSSTQSEWTRLRADYEAKRAYSDSLPYSTPDKIEDEAVDDWCEAADTLILSAAPNRAELVYKIRLMQERCDGFEMDAGFIDAIVSDVQRLAVR